MRGRRSVMRNGSGISMNRINRNMIRRRRRDVKRWKINRINRRNNRMNKRSFVRWNKKMWRRKKKTSIRIGMQEISGKRKYMFIKDNMSRSEGRLGVKVIQLVTFNGIRVTNKDTRYSPMKIEI